MSKKTNPPQPNYSFPKAPKPKSKGKKHAPPPLKGMPDVDVLDIFQSMLETDAGSDPSHQNPGNFYASYLSQMSKPQIRRLDRKIHRMYNKKLQHSSDNKRTKKTYHQFRDAINEHIEKARSHEIALQERITKTLKQLKIEEVEVNKAGKITHLQLNKKRYSIIRFINTFLSAIHKNTHEMIASGKLVRESRRHSARWFLIKAIEDALLD